MIQSSETIGALAKALSQAQGAFPVIAKNHTGVVKGQTSKGAYEYSYAYADLADTVSAVQPILKANGLAVTQFPGFDGEHHTLAADLFVTGVEDKVGIGHRIQRPVAPAFKLLVELGRSVADLG